jgi:hypothetical protein
VQVTNSGLGTACKGWASTKPDVIVKATAAFTKLRLYVRSAGDTTLIVRDPAGGWHCNDDMDGRDPEVTIDGAVKGTYRVWVGKYGEVMDNNVAASLYITERARVTAPTTGAPAAPASPVLRLVIDGAKAHAGMRALTAGFAPDPLDMVVQAGGRVSIGALQLGSACKGWASIDPDVILDFTSTSQYLRVSVTSPADTALIVLDPRGRWQCNDDANGLNPEVVVTDAPTGRYRIWVAKIGTAPALEGADFVRSTLSITERRR